MCVLNQMSLCLILLLSLNSISISSASEMHALLQVLTFKEAVNQAHSTCGIDARPFHQYGEHKFEGWKRLKTDLSGLTTDETRVICLAASLCEQKNTRVSAEKQWYRATSFCKVESGLESPAAYTTEDSIGEEDPIGGSKTTMEERDVPQIPQANALVVLSTSDIKTFTFGFMSGGIVFFIAFKAKEQLGIQTTSTVLRRRPEL